MFQIVKTLNGWFHRYNSGAKSVNISDFEVTLDEVANTFVIVQRNGSNIPLNKLSVNDIEVIDETSGSIVETFTNVIDLKARLMVLGYTAYLGAGNADSITGLIQEGTNVTITGSGTLADPYIISASGGGGTTPTLQQVTDEGSQTTNTITIDKEDEEALIFNNLGDIVGNITNASDGAVFSSQSKTAPSTDNIEYRNGKIVIRKGNVTSKTLHIPYTGETDGNTIATREWVTANPPSVVVDADDVTETATRVFVTPAQKTILSNTSGTNSGDNATNTTSNAYADAKVADTITNGVTTIAPSQNAVFDALALKADKSDFEDWTDFSGSSTIVGWTTPDISFLRYSRVFKSVTIRGRITGTSNSSSTNLTIPFTIANFGPSQANSSLLFTNNGIASPTSGVTIAQNNSNQISFFRDGSLLSWTNSGTKTINFEITFIIQ
jgi:hypothetical protein